MNTILHVYPDHYMYYFTGTYLHSVIQEYEFYENSKFTNKPTITSIYK